jgi:FO synthase
MSPDEVLSIARRGAELGCKEALITLGDRPEDRWPEAREWLEAEGYDDTIAYVRAMAIRILEETGLLPHLNPGALSWTDFQRLKPVATAMRGMPDAELDELVATVAVARHIMGPSACLQAPPNLVDDQYAALIGAGIDDWGGVSPITPDHVNPERPWPQIDELAERSAAAGFALRERLAVYPEFVQRGEPWLDPRLLPHVRALADPETGLARTDVAVEGRPWQEPDDVFVASGRTDLHHSIDTDGRTSDRRDDFDEVYGDWEALREAAAPVMVPGPSPGPPHGQPDGAEVPEPAPGGGTSSGMANPRGSGPGQGASIDADLRSALSVAADDPVRLTDSEALALLHADGPALDALCRIADDLRRDVVGDDVTYIVTRNINFTNVCYTGCRFCAFAQRRTDADAYTLSLAQVADRAQQAWDVGAVEVCMQGGIHPDLPGTAYFDIARAVKERVPGMHVHAFSPMEVANGATRTGMSIREWLSAAQDAGLDTIPGTAAEILDDEVRWILTKGKLPADTWVEVVKAAHALGIRSSSTMMYGHVDQPRHWLGHLRLLAGIQQAALAENHEGFTEFVTLPFVHTNAPVYLAGIARPGPTLRDNRAVTAMARLLLHPYITNIQTSWVKLGAEGAAEMLRSGANDLGGTLMEETISRMAGSRYGSHRSIKDLTAIADAAGRPARPRTTTYGEVPAERREAAFASDGRLPELLPVLGEESAHNSAL